jgi:hypothetical protein
MEIDNIMPEQKNSSAKLWQKTGIYPLKESEGD